MLEEKAKHLAKSHIFQASARYGWQQSLVFAGGRLVVPRKSTLRGIDPSNGKVDWELTNIISSWQTPTIWKHGGREYLVCTTGGKLGEAQLKLINASDGHVTWEAGGLDATQFNLAISDDIVLVNIGSQITKEKANGSAPRRADGEAPFGRLAAYQLSLDGPKRIWALPNLPQFLIPT